VGEPGVTDLVRRFNRGRDPERLALKLAKMKESPFIFLRGACHLFYDNLPATPALDRAPLAWACGDLHFENYGSYKADNRLAYFDINDYDEAALAPCTWDLVRLLTSLQCGADALAATADEALAVSRDCLAAYRDALARGKPLWVEAETASGLVADLLLALGQRKRRDFLDRRTVLKGHQRHLMVNGIKALPASAEDQAAVRAFMAGFAAGQSNPAFFEVLDVARRIAGTGSLGVARFVILVAGKGAPDGNYLLDLKSAQPTALGPALQRRGIAQPDWGGEARRVVGVQGCMQAVDHAFLYPVEFAGQPFILKGLQPSEDRVDIAQWGGKLERLRNVARTMGHVLAWDQLRASGRRGAACADELIAFARQDDSAKELLDVAVAMAGLTRRQWNEFTQAEA